MRTFILITTLFFSQALFSQDFFSYIEDGFSKELVVLDFNNDGYLDFISKSGIGLFQLYTNDKRFRPQFSPSFLQSGSNVASIQEIDIDQDGDIDIVGTEDGVMTLHINDGQGAFSSQQTNISGALQYHAGDMNGDGVMDIVGLVNQSLFVYTQNSPLDYSELEIESNLQSLETFDVMDIDNDGDPRYSWRSH